MKKWKIINKFKIQNSKFKIDSLIKVILENRGIRTQREIEEFLEPKLSELTISNVDIDKKQLKRAIDRIKKAIFENEQIVVFGDYDVDGICGTAILWETLNDLGAKVIPYIPHRMDEGYGLSIRGIENIKSQIPDPKVIITIDNGIVANSAVDFANQSGIDVIITDHHVASAQLPKAHAIVHTIKVCGAGVAWLLSQEIRAGKIRNTHLELVALATVADLVPLKDANRTFVKFGIDELRKTERPGILAIIKEAGLEQNSIGTYEIGHIIAPRLNAMGRLEYAMDSLRLLCTKDSRRAESLAHKMGNTNRRRQEVTFELFEHARLEVKSQKPKVKSLIFVGHESYQQGVVGLIAGRLVEEFYRPSIVVSKGEIYSKASARSINGFNIIELIRSASELLVDAGGHPMAAGFTVETEKLSLLQRTLEERAAKFLNTRLLKKTLRIDCELMFSWIDTSLYDVLQKLSPFGIGNPIPTFLTRKVTVEDMRIVGIDRKHLKLRLSQPNSQVQFNAIGFGMGERSNEIRIGDKVDFVYQIEKEVWNGNSRLQLKIRDFQKIRS